MNIGIRARMETAKLAVRMLRATGFYDGYWGRWRGSIFDYAEQRGLHILPVHYYSPIPKTLAAKELETSPRASWDDGAERLAELVGRYEQELSVLFRSGGQMHGYDPQNASYSPTDAAVLYAVVRDGKPGKIIEIGSGRSTLVMATAIRAARREEPSYAPQLVCIEPYPPDYLTPPPAEVTEVMTDGVQSLPLKLFAALGPGDILFIDSTHVAKYGSDVVYEYLEILPALAPGVRIHVHDIFLPFDYPSAWIEELRFFWNEQYILQAFLAMNQNFRIDYAVHAAARRFGLPLGGAIADHPSSTISCAFWMTRV